MMKYFSLLIIAAKLRKLVKTQRYRLLFYLFVVTIGGFLLYAQPSNTQQIKDYSRLDNLIDSMVTKAIKAEAFPGCVIYGATSDSIFYHQAYGYHTYDSIRKVSLDDIYDLASITKIAGATLAIMKLYEDGLVQLDDPISNYIKDIRGDIGKVTIREAMAHQGGLYPWIPYHQVIRKKNGEFKKKDVDNAADLTHDFQLGDSLFLNTDFYHRSIKKLIGKSKVAENPTYKYSGLFFYLVPEMVQSLTGISFDKYLSENFYDVITAETMGFLPTKRFPLSRIPPTELDTFFRKKLIHGEVHDEGAIMMRGISGNAGLFSNAADLGKVMNIFSYKRKNGPKSLLKDQTIALFTTSQYPNLNNRRGLGFDKPLLEYDPIASSVAKSASIHSFGHTGYTGTIAWVDPVNDLNFIFLSNRVYPSRSNKALYQLNVRPIIHQYLYDYLNSLKSAK